MKDKVSIKEELANLQKQIDDATIKESIQMLASSWEKIKQKDLTALPDVKNNLDILNRWLATATPSDQTKETLLTLTNELTNKIQSIPLFLLNKEKKEQIKALTDVLNELKNNTTKQDLSQSTIESNFQKQYAPNKQIRPDAVTYCQKLNTDLQQLVELKQLKDITGSVKKMAEIMGIKPKNNEKREVFIKAIEHFNPAETEAWKARMNEREQREHAFLKPLGHGVKKIFHRQSKNPLDADALNKTLEQSIAALSSKISGNNPDFAQQLISSTPSELRSVQEKSQALVVILQTKQQLDALQPPKTNIFHQLWEKLQAVFGFETPRAQLSSLLNECKSALSTLDPTKDKTKIDNLKDTPLSQKGLSAQIEQAKTIKNILTSKSDSFSDTIIPPKSNTKLLP